MIHGVSYSLESLSPELLTEVEPLLAMHSKEVSHYPDIPLDPDYEGYYQIQDRGGLRVFVARDERKVLIGYSVFFIRRGMHYRSSLQAYQDILFIHPERRGFGMRFIDWCDGVLRTEGVQVVYQHLKFAADFSKMLERLDYEKIDMIMGRRLDR